MTLLRQNFLAKLAAENASHPLLSRHGGVVYMTAENDGEAAMIMQDAQGDAVAANAEMESMEESSALAEKAEDAGEAFNAAAATVEAGGEVPEATVAQADALASDVATAVGADVAEMVPSIPAEDREVIQENANPIAGESAAFKFSRGYAISRKDPAILRLAGESMMTAVKGFASSAYDSVMKAYNYICQWIGKYFGTYQRALSRFQKLKERATKDTSGRKKDQGKIEDLKGTDVMTLAVWSGPTNDTPKYLTKSSEISDGALKFKGIITSLVDYDRGATDLIREFTSTINSVDVTTLESATEAFDNTLEKYMALAGNDVKGEKITDATFAKEYLALPNLDKYYAFGADPIPGYKMLFHKLSKAKLSKEDKEEINKLVSISDRNAAKTGARSDLAATKLSTRNEIIQRLGIVLVDGNKNGKKNLKDSLSVDAFTGGEIEDMAMNMISVIEDLVSYRNSKGYLKNKEALDKLRSADKKLTDKISNQLGKIDNGADKSNDADTRALAKSTLEICKLLLRNFDTMKSVFLAFDKYMLLIEKLCNKSLSNYVAND